MDSLPWVQWPWSRRCKARLRRRANGLEKRVYYGRCELSPHGKEIPHALERGMINIRWKDYYNEYAEHTEFAKMVLVQRLRKQIEEDR